jgi:hypothetical protein
MGAQLGHGSEGFSCISHGQHSGLEGECRGQHA